MSCKELLCRFFAQGTCNFGENCMYSHDPESSVPIPEDACLFFLRSNCFYGDACLKKHKTISQIVNGEECGGEEVKQEMQVKAASSVDYGATPCSSKCPGMVTRSYASAASMAGANSDSVDDLASKLLCSFFESNGQCVYPSCTNVHGEFCDLCGLYSLHPYNETQRKNHREDCIKEHEKEMELSFAYQRSKDMTCGICLDVVMEKESLKARRFGILENCTHVYCIECIRTWRNSSFDKKNKRGCPQCRVKSDYVIPSEYFYNDKSEKEKLISTYKEALSSKHCKYFNRGEGKCPFEGACFYKHEYPDGRKAELPMPTRRRGIKSGSLSDFASLMDALMDLSNDIEYESYEDIFLESDDDSDDDFLYEDF